MRKLNLSISNELFGKLVGAAATLGQDTKQTVREFLQDGADIVLGGHYYEIEDETTFHRLQQEAQRAELKN